MEARIITEETIERFHAHLLFEEKSAATVEKYIRDAKAFMLFTDGAAITKEMVIGYKQKLIADGYAVRSVNSILASVNSLLVFLGWSDCKVKSLKLQREIYCSEEKELTKAEYMRLVNTAKKRRTSGCRSFSRRSAAQASASANCSLSPLKPSGVVMLMSAARASPEPLSSSVICKRNF